MKDFRLPGWVAPLLVALLATAADFFQGEQFQGADWAPLVGALLILVGKSLELALEKRREAAHADGWVASGPLRGTPVRVYRQLMRTRWSRWLWGG